MSPRFQAIHTALFVTGIVALPLGLVFPRHGVLLVSGVCFALSGVMTIAGYRITMRGPLGAFFRRALGGARRGGAYLMGSVWLLFGALLVVVSLLMTVGGEPPPHEVLPPTAPTG